MVSILGIVKVPIYVLHVVIDPDYSKVIENIFWLMVIHNVATESFFCQKVFTFTTSTTLEVGTVHWAEWAGSVFILTVTSVSVVSSIPIQLGYPVLHSLVLVDPLFGCICVFTLFTIE